MAKSPKTLGVFAKTDVGSSPDDNEDLEIGNIKATGIGLRIGELAALQSIADSLNVARNGIMRAMIRWAIKEYRAGRLDLAGLVEEPPPQKKKLKMP